MPQARVYKTGSVIYFVGDKAQYVYILKQGVVQSIHLSVETGEETREIVKVGEFFGVKSVLGFYPQEETMQVLSNSSVVLLTPIEFESLVNQSTGIIIKMLKVFSNQLRRINRKARSILTDTGDISSSELEIFKVGEVYLGKKRYKEAIYAYTRYLQYAGDSAQFAAVARKKMAECKASLGMELSQAEMAAREEEAPSISISGDAPSDDFGLGPTASEAPSIGIDFDTPADAPKASPSAAFNFDDVPTAAPKPAPKAEPFDIKKGYYNGLSMFSQGKYAEALAAFKEVTVQKQVPTADFPLIEKSYFEIGRCLHKMKKYPESVGALADFVKKYPDSETMREGIIVIGQVHEDMGQMQKAAAYYTKVSQMTPKDDFTRRAGKLLEAVKGKM
ncbi:MAG: tetratricopeptide repeat protein [Spirochaetota bacterium]